jgi:hypothetical protein
MIIYFDMDGTIADLYGVDGWLDMLVNKNPKPYKEAKPLVDMRTFARMLHIMQNEGIEIGIISWLSKCSDEDYDEAVTRAKMKWLKTHLASVEFNEIHILPYGTPKSSVVTKPHARLFDDEPQNRIEFRGQDRLAYDVGNIIAVLKNILANN